MIKFLIPLAALTIAGCVSQAANGEERAVSKDITCQFDDPSHAGASAEDVCAMFVDRISAVGLGKPLAISIAAPTVRAAEAVVRDAEGNIVAENQFDVMDTQLSLATWEDFSAATAKAVAKLKR